MLYQLSYFRKKIFNFFARLFVVTRHSQLTASALAPKTIPQYVNHARLFVVARHSQFTASALAPKTIPQWGYKGKYLFLIRKKKSLLRRLKLTEEAEVVFEVEAQVFDLPL